jgi:hypothetical protein
MTSLGIKVPVQTNIFSSMAKDVETSHILQFIT